MREIKFRAIHKLTKKKWTNEELVFHNGAWYEDWRAFEDGTPLNMTQCAVMQYTGLKDKYGVEIYEGDIVLNLEHNQETKGVVVFVRGGFRVALNIKGFKFNLPFNSFEENEYSLQVLGNIYENPELLECEAE